MAVVKKVSPRGITSKAPEKVDAPQETSAVERKVISNNTNTSDYIRPKKVCNFCKSKSTPRYWDAAALRKFMNDRGRISSRIRSGNCAKHQRCIAREIKRARHLALLPFTIKV